MLLPLWLADVGHLTPLNHPSFLHHGSSIERGELEPLEQVQAPVEGDLPAMVGGDAAGMEIGAGINLPGEWRAGGGERVLHLAEVFNLFFERFLVRAGDQVNGYSCRRIAGAKAFRDAVLTGMEVGGWKRADQGFWLW